jgi:hypothetical protein
MDEFKFMILFQLPNLVALNGYHGGISGVAVPTAGATSFNLYTNPQEDDSVAVRHLPMAVPFDAELKRYADVLQKFPARIQIQIPH